MSDLKTLLLITTVFLVSILSTRACIRQDRADCEKMNRQYVNGKCL